MNKATVLVVLILVSVAFSAPVLANGYEESHEHAEYDSQPDGWLDTGTEESRTEHDGRVGHEGHVGHGEATPGQEEAIPQPAVPVTPPTPAEEPLSDDELVTTIITAVILAALVAGVFGRGEIMEVITALRKWNLSGRPGGLAGLGDVIFGEKPAGTVTTQPVSTAPVEKPEKAEKPTPPTPQDYVENKIKRDQDYIDASDYARKAKKKVTEARNNLDKCEREFDDFVETAGYYKGQQLPEYEEQVKKARETLAAAWTAQDKAFRALYDQKQASQLFYREKYAEEFGLSK